MPFFRFFHRRNLIQPQMNSHPASRIVMQLRLSHRQRIRIINHVSITAGHYDPERIKRLLPLKVQNRIDGGFFFFGHLNLTSNPHPHR
jgi:hypothetical protein